MGVTVERLALLEELEQQRDGWEQRIRDINEAVREPRELLDLRAALQNLDRRLQELATEQTDVDLRQQAMVARIAGEDQRLYGGTIKNPRELQDLQSEIASLRSQLEDIQLRELEVMERVEAAQQERATTEKMMTTVERRWLKEGRALLREREQLKESLTRVEPQVAALRQTFTPAVLATFDRLRAQKGGQAVARLQGRMCLGCHTDLPEVEARAARGTDAMVQCSGCRRLLRA